MKWQPISTAPKDGTKVLLLEGKEIFAGAWEKDFECLGSINDDLNQMAFRAGWTDWSFDQESELMVREIFPTKWMPLPALPEETCQTA